MTTIQTASNGLIYRMGSIAPQQPVPQVHHEQRAPRVHVDTLSTTVANRTFDMVDRFTGSRHTMATRRQEQHDISSHRVEMTTHQTTQTVQSEHITARSQVKTDADQPISIMTRHQEMETALQQSQAINFLNIQQDDLQTQTESKETPVVESGMTSLAGDMLQDPSATFAATMPSQDRLSIVSMLSYDTQTNPPTYFRRPPMTSAIAKSRDTSTLLPRV